MTPSMAAPGNDYIIGDYDNSNTPPFNGSHYLVGGTGQDTYITGFEYYSII